MTSHPDTHYHSLTIREAIEKIHASQLVLPLLQRDLVWDARKAAQLFDSVLQNFPINSMLFWEITPESLGQVPMYSFIQHYTQYSDDERPYLDAIHDNKIINNNKLHQHAESDSLMAVLDGQQRLASFYMGLTGTYAWRKEGWYSKARNFPPRQLFLRLLEGTVETHNDNLEEQTFYQLAWKEIGEEEIIISSSSPRIFRWDERRQELWLRVGAVLDFIPELNIEPQSLSNVWANQILAILDEDTSLAPKQRDVFKEIIQQTSFRLDVGEILSRLYKSVHEERHISYYLLDKSKDIAAALATFVRINSGGLTLSAANLLFSALSTRWTESNIRNILKDLEHRLKREFPSLNQTFILKTALAMVSDKNLPVSLANFKAEYIQRMKDNWVLIEDSLVKMVELVFEPKISGEADPMPQRRINFLQNTSLLTALAYYYYKAGQLHYSPTLTDTVRMRRWLIRAKLMWWEKQAAAETKLTHVMRIIKQHLPIDSAISDFPFPYHPLLDAGLVENGPNLNVKQLNNDSGNAAMSIEGLLQTQKYHLTTRFLLGLIQWNAHDQETYEIDHCFPYLESRDSEDEEWKEQAEILSNLQLLESRLNSSKSAKPFRQWYDEIPEILTRDGMSDRLGVTNREELVQAHCWPEYLSAPQMEDSAGNKRLALFEFTSARYQLLFNRLSSIISDHA